MSENSAVQLSLAYTNFNANFSGSSDESRISGFGAEGMYKFYFSSEYDAPRSWYAAPLVGYSVSQGTSGSAEGEVSVFGAGAVAGYQWIFGGGNSGFALDLNLGAQYLNITNSGDITDTGLGAIMPRLGLSLGYAW